MIAPAFFFCHPLSMRRGSPYQSRIGAYPRVYFFFRAVLGGGSGFSACGSKPI